MCGQVRYSADAEPAFVGVCHCKNCQKASGTAFRVVLAVPKPALSVQGALKTFDVPYLVTLGGPNYATEFLGTFIYRVSIPQAEVGYGAALSIMLLILALAAGIDAKGASIDDFRHVDGARGSFQDRFLVYAREGEPCATCGRPIRKLTVGGRGTYVCERCQPRPRVRRA